MGAKVSRGEKRRREAHRHSLLRAVERFVVNVYSSGPRVDAIRLMLTSEMASRAFSQFVVSEHAEDTYTLYTGIITVRPDRMTNYAITSTVEGLIRAHIVDNAPKQVIVSAALFRQCVEILRADKDAASYMMDVKKLVWNLTEETLFLLARDHFSRFLTSKYYKNWRAAEASHAIAHTEEEHKEIISSVRMKGDGSYTNILRSKRNAAEDAPTTKRRSLDKLNPISSLPFALITPRGKPEKSLSDEKKRKRQEELSFSAFSNVDAHELGKVLGAESWLAALISAAEALPICFSLATARRDRRGFPLMYVNKHFEKVTGYTRKDVIGKSCRFLQCAFSEKESIEQLGESLKLAIATQVVITNARYDGTIFKNLVAVKPIFNESRQYCYVMAVHMDVTREVDQYVSKNKLLSELMAMLPDVLLHDDRDEPGCCG
jgi:PAS domain S-box-containing protein